MTLANQAGKLTKLFESRRSLQSQRPHEVRCAELEDRPHNRPL